jgi:hypothetical protein
MSNKVYDVLKWIVVLVLPATATLYSVLSGIWGLPYGDAIPNTITAVDAFLGAVLMISSAQYNKKASE